ncbi:MAG: response regulator [Deferribacteres bacterium]|nr:response regulator [candidate division KSB1 bacterium]MCB9503285.1 response regulator [Deferribacteres bacterium]
MAQKVLIVDDEPSIVLSLEFLMQQKGYDLKIARTGDEALQFIDEFQPDLVLLDVMLPNKNGFEICQYVRSKPEFTSMKIILLTAKGRKQDIEKGLAIGADAYITKPFATRDLVQTVQNMLKK